ncbi:hypothetical protein [methanotrophic endosymbiont of Bathymodiolus puteoserpentis (Logatchev)]|uniref:hypothetical protein n=1 Tax=methanotrophic endosymbiont of Bathymodiolus puteoserpentis (Logatchev) TaxID=343235 RepID=UPI0013CC0680|nr:hypothetical protein [methanotrophic endosymbiont of Bathymodiolus puteoserpentis (Logatchev)]SHE22448.1 hypothetical protein BPUTEOMOX_1403 [methanotrophic endosymbiont of Bathymodiolus puteoserpentis (Logatchev)]
MGQEINISAFNPSDFTQFYQKLNQETECLKDLIKQGHCSQKAPIAGFEIEAWLIDDTMQASPNNASFLATLNDPLAFPELAKFNIELNSIPEKLIGTVFSNLHKNLSQTWNKACTHSNSQFRISHISGIGISSPLSINSSNDCQLSKCM